MHPRLLARLSSDASRPPLHGCHATSQDLLLLFQVPHKHQLWSVGDHFLSRAGHFGKCQLRHALMALDLKRVVYVFCTNMPQCREMPPLMRKYNVMVT